MVRKLVFGVALAAATAVSAFQGVPMYRRDQDAALRDHGIGKIRSLDEIERQVKSKMGGASYLGPEYDPGSSRYRLKFMRNGSVIWLDVDGRTGQVISKSGN